MDIWAYILSSLGVLGLLVLIILIGGFWFWKKIKDTSKAEDCQAPQVREATRHKVGGLMSYGELYLATNGFSETCKLGSGGFGNVYRARLSGKDVAIKRLAERSRQGQDEYSKEVAMLSMLKHVNIVKICGHCSHNDERLIIYELMPHGSLDHHLKDVVKKGQLTWNQRVRIIIDIAEGLLYMHKLSGYCMAHLDLKPANILLDANKRAKIADLGMSRLLENRQPGLLAGTHGYRDPFAFENGGEWSSRCDIYSFGVVMLNLLTGKEAVLMLEPDYYEHVATWAWPHRYEIDKLKDATLHLDYNSSKDFMWLVELAFVCVQKDPQARPFAPRLVHWLHRIDHASLPKPKKPFT